MIDKTTNSVNYQGGEDQSVFPIPFPFLETNHIRASIRDAGGKARALIAGTDYAINGISEEDGEFILLGDPLASGEILTITRLVPLTQEILFHNQGPNSPQAMEEATDKLTMITQQLQTGLDSCLSLPDGMSSGEVEELLAEGLTTMASISSLKETVDAKAPLAHSHEISSITNLSNRLDGKAAATHSHAQADVTGLTAALSGKADSNDPRLAGIPHADRHAVNGSDPLRPEDIGALSLPPADGKPYLAAAGGWIEYIASSGGGEGGTGSQLDHSQLLNRNAADQHPQSAIQNLTGDLANIRTSLLEKAGRDELSETAADDRDGLMSATDKRKLDAFNSLPSGGAANDFLSLDTGGVAAWKTPAQTAGALPLMSATQKGVARLAADAGLELDAGGALRITADSLVSKANIEGRLGALSSLSDRLDALGTMALVDDAPENGKSHLRKDGAWLEFTAGSAGGGAILGEIRLLPFRQNALPTGWYFCNGDQFALSTTQGAALNALPATMRSDWGITVSGANINLPNLFSGSDGYFLRAVNNSDRQPGTTQGDAIRNITGSFMTASDVGVAWISSPAGRSVVSGALTMSATGSAPFSFTTYSHGANTIGAMGLDASKAVPTASENRP